MLTAKEHAAKFEKSMRCNCDLDNWQPTAATGHSQVCRIHTTAIAAVRSARSEVRGEVLR